MTRVVTPVNDQPFEWPCERRDAHHAHPLPCDKNCRPNSEPDEDDFHYPDCAALMGCSGVPAHPATQIGGGYTRY